MSKSILQAEKECYLCRLAADQAGYYGDLPQTGLHRHHVIFGRGNRKKSEHFGLWVWLCVAHHEYGPEAVHTNARIRRQLSQIAQREITRVYPNLDFREEFGISYIDPDETPQTRIMTGCGTDRVEDGFAKIETGLETGMPF